MERNTTDVDTIMLIGLHEALTPELLQQIYSDEPDAVKHSDISFFKAVLQWIHSQFKGR
ncbi:hypothetical protein [Acinetobacter tianfuensis]|uniref:hypothetical protein n=1 Tax=Acinetobacter tianfuensis TaxID=2419603 RepID=UPI00148C6065|nr:hypothetical protein [Acinetobacter tianfuensis]